MIDYISGPIASLSPATVVIDCSGIGYEINITLLDYSKASSQTEAKFYIHEAIREDAYILYGFLSTRERELFRLLIGVSGVGPNTARLILSSLSASELEQVIAVGDHNTLKNVKGIGAKTAQRIIVDLKDKIKGTDVTFTQCANTHNQVFDDALTALTVLGFAPAQSHKALKKVFAEHPELSTDQAVRMAIKNM